MEPLKFDNKKKTVFFLIIAMIALLIMYLFFFRNGPSEPAGDPDGNDIGVEMTLPEAKTKDMEDSKVNAIRSSVFQGNKRERGNINDAWDDLLRGKDSSGVVANGSPSGSYEELDDPGLLKKYYGDDLIDVKQLEKEAKELERESSGLKTSKSSSGGGGGGGGASRARASSGTQPSSASSVVAQVPPSAGASDPAAESSSASGPSEERGVVHSMRSEMMKGRSSGTVPVRKAPPAGMVSSKSPVRCQFVRDELLSSGERVTVRLLDPLQLAGVTIPANSRLSATVSVGSRVDLDFSGYQADGRIYSINYSAYDTDGKKGLYCSAVDPAAKQAGEQALDGAMSVASGVVSAVGGIAGRVASGALNVGRVATRGGAEKVSIPSGFTFYIVEN